MKKLLLLVFLLQWGWLRAQIVSVQTDTITFDEVVIVAQRSSEKYYTSLSAISLLQEKQIRQLSPGTLPEAMERMPGVWMQRTNLGGGSPFIRGLTGYQTLILIDGIRLNNATFRSGPNQYLNTVDPLMCSKIEVMRGSGSVQYGSDAIGGTVYIQTIEPEYSNQKPRITGSVYGKWMSDSMEKSTRAQLGFSSKKLALVSGFSIKKFGDIHPGKQGKVLSPTGYSGFSGDLKLKIKLDHSKEMIFAIQHDIQQDVPLYHQIQSGTFSLYSFDPQQRSLAYLKFKMYTSHPLFSEIKATISIQSSFEQRNKRKSDADHTDVEKDGVTTSGFILENISSFSEKWIATTGVESYYDHIASSASTILTDGVSQESERGLYPDNSSMLSTSLFTIHKIEQGRLSIQTGARYNFIELVVDDPMFGESHITPDALVGLLSAGWALSPLFRISASANTAYRAPNISDVSSFGIADFRYEVPNFGLKPEKAFNMELGFQFKREGWFASLFLYRNLLTDLIDNVKTTYGGQDSIDGIQVYHRENIHRAIIRGAEAELTHVISSNLSARAYAIYTYGFNSENNEPIRRIPPFNGYVGGIYRPFRQLSFDVGMMFASSQNRLSSGDIDDDRIADGGTPGWTSVHIESHFEWKILKFNTGLENIFNTLYRVHGSGVDAPGRRFWVSLTIGF